MNTSHEHLTSTVQFIAAGWSCVVTIEISDIVFESSILSATIARGPSITKLIGQCNEETSIGVSGGVHNITEEFTLCDEGGDKSGGECG